MPLELVYHLQTINTDKTYALAYHQSVGLEKIALVSKHELGSSCARFRPEPSTWQPAFKTLVLMLYTAPLIHCFFTHCMLYAVCKHLEFRIIKSLVVFETIWPWKCIERP